MRTLLLALLLASPAFAQKEFGFDNTKSSGQPYLKPEETVAKFKVAPEFEVKLFAGEPLMTNPIAFTIDEKGRIWIVESFEYPKRTPKGKKPRDRIVILEDTDGDGVADKRTVFAEGKDFPESFDMASGIEVGHGGVYVGAPPYLWFIENKDDKPGKFEILAKGFGSQDTHETLNTFQWGPDGWLYGLHGVFTQSNVKAGDQPEIKMNAAVWRLHPKTKKFEIFSEGTSNPWGMDWRNTDGQFILACCVIPHLYHMVPGGIYRRQGGVHSNPYTYGDIKEISDHTFHRESGWAHAGLISLDVPHMPEKYRNSVIFGSIHGCSLKQNILKPNGSSYVGSKGEDFLTSGDKNFRPINLKWGPLGDIYLIDWHDQNPCHQTKADDWDYERGRVYRIQLKGTATKKATDIGNATSKQLAAYLQSNNPYEFRTALRLTQERIQERRELEHALDRTEGIRVQKEFKPLPDGTKGPFCLTTLPPLTIRSAIIDRTVHQTHWLLSGEEAFTKVWPNFDRRKPADAWAMTIRLWADRAFYEGDTFRFLIEQAERSDNPISARRELASAAIRIVDHPDAGDPTPLVRALMSHKEDATDPLIPHLTWLAYEKLLAKSFAKPASKDENGKPVEGTSPLDAELAWLTANAAGNAFVTEQIIPKVMRRLVATNDAGKLDLCVKFVGSLKDATAKRKALEGLAVAVQGQQLTPPKAWADVRQSLLRDKDAGTLALVNKIAVSFRDPQVFQRMLALMGNAKQTESARIEAIRQVAAYGDVKSVDRLMDLVREEKSDALRVEAVRALGGINNKDVAIGLVSNWDKLTAPVRAEVVTVLAGRKEWAAALLSGMQTKIIDRTFVTDNTILKIQALNDKKLNAMIEDVWGRSRPTPDELNKLIDKTRNDINTQPGSFARGAKVFEAQCAKCHKFEGKGNEVGPQLDGAGRDIEYLLGNILDPNRVIGAPYFVRQINTLDGQVIQGVLAEEDDTFITLKIENAVLKKIAKKEIDGKVKVLEKSMMPEGLGNTMTAENFRDVVRYVMAHPFLTDLTLDGKPVSAPVGGRIPLPEAKDGKPVVIEAKFTADDAVKTKLFVGAGDAFELSLDGKPVGKGNGDRNVRPDMEAFDVTLPKGEHTLTITLQHKGVARWAYARFLDPERKLGYAEAK
ncbi:PVC-type heme-binding CxxCH protein [Limnoglobus roseus]|uniref:Putative beta-propeller-type glycoside hydrolase n=1 Tax=Limnoglobus roseus TaxID=2598579 RepID=A0A5C1A6H8_9BACT|nr:PVC-type heme-binding CxxCH protein [Limnoglobus roseus]QEL13985.1 putative beta-propeller-type glycoside hydrolase [Limnoglobus roseus]